VTSKNFYLSAEDIETLLPPLGGCMATSAILVEGMSVATMTREDPIDAADSGWLFTAGSETQQELDDAATWTVVEVNTLANYDPAVIPYLTWPPGSYIARDPGDGRLRVMDGPDDIPQMRLMEAQGPGPARISRTRAVRLDRRMLARIDDGTIVYWTDGFTIMVRSWAGDGRDGDAHIDEALAEASPERTDQKRGEDDGLSLLSYRLVEASERGVQNGLYCFAANEGGVVQLAIYWDDPEDANAADTLWASLHRLGD
jgi:hypothetical protein